MPASLAISVRSALDADAEAVWSAVTRLQQVNEELGWLSLKLPFGYDRVEASLVRANEPVCHGSLVAYGAVPIDRWSFGLEQVDDGRFVERSSTLWFKSWRHERVVEERGEGSAIVDRIVAVPRLPGFAVFLAPLIARLFAARHRRLRNQFGSPDTGAPRVERTLGAGAEQEAAVVVGGTVLAVVAAGVTAYLLRKRKG